MTQRFYMIEVMDQATQTDSVGNLSEIGDGE
jgi:hypothetical protein